MSPSRILGKIRIEVAVINRNRIEIIPYWIVPETGADPKDFSV